MTLDLDNEILYVPTLHHPDPWLLPGWTGGLPESPAPAVPDAPTWNAVGEIGETHVVLNWNDNSDNETGFKVQKSAVSDSGPWTDVATTAANVTTYDVTGLTHDTTYWFQVIATNGAGDSASTGTVEVTTVEGLPAAPSDLDVLGEGANSIDLFWTDNSDNEDGFSLYGRDVTADESFLIQSDIGQNQTSLTGLTHNGTGFIAGHTYEYKIRAFNNTGESADSALLVYVFGA